VPIPQTLLHEIKRFRVISGAFGGLVFPSAKGSKRALGREAFQHAREGRGHSHEAAKARCGAWHSLSRKWASERKHLPLVDVAAVGGWKDTQILVNCYQHEDRETMLAVMSEPRKVTERAVGT